MKNKAYTLVELIAVIVIIGLILLIATPGLSNLFNNSKNEKYEYYYKMVGEAAEVYAKTKKDKLGNSLSTGCIYTDVDILVEGGFLKSYTKNDEGVMSSQIVINNNYGKLSFDIYLKIGKGNKVSYEKGSIKDTSTCINYVSSSSTDLQSIFTSSGYVNITNNYIWYSGRLWRGIWVSSNKEEIKLITDEIVGIVPFNDISTNSSFSNSYIEKWLNQYFINTLYNPNNYLNNYNWVNSSSYSPKKIGLVSKSDIDDSLGIVDNSDYWTLTTDSNRYLYISDGTTEEYSISLGVKPSVFLKSSIKVVGGTGTKSDPYQLEKNKIITQSGKKLNTRYSGEYVSINGNKYRIIDIIDGKTKVIAVNGVDNKTYSDIYDTTSNNYKGLDISGFSELLEKGNWYVGNNLNSKQYIFGEINTNITSYELGIPMFAEIIYFDDNNTKEYWTLTKDHDDNNIMLGLTSKGRKIFIQKNQAKSVKYLLYIKEDVKIKSGTGQKNDPFVIK